MTPKFTEAQLERGRTVPALNVTRKPTIYEALKAQLGREPTHAEIKADVHRILGEVLIDLRNERAR